MLIDNKNISNYHVTQLNFKKSKAVLFNLIALMQFFNNGQKNDLLTKQKHIGQGNFKHKAEI